MKCSSSITLGVLGGALGLGLAYGALRILVAKGPDTLPRLNEIGIDPLVLSFAFGVSLLSGVLFGAHPDREIRRTSDRDGAAGIGRTFSHDRERHRGASRPGRRAGGARARAVDRLRLDDPPFQHLRSVQPGFTP